MHQQIFDKERLSLNIVRYKKGGQNFEVIISDPDKALDLRHGKDIPVSDVMNGDMIFSDAKKGQAAPESGMKEWLGTTDHKLAAEIIIKKGDFHLTADQKRAIAQAKRRKILNYLHENAVDPRTKLPHPVSRIELAMEQAKVQIDPTDKVEWLIDKIVPQIQKVLPVSFERANFRVVIPARFAGSAYSAVKGKYKLQNEQWLNDGGVQFELDVIAGSKSKIIDMLNRLTNGEVKIEEL